MKHLYTGKTLHTVLPVLLFRHGNAPARFACPATFRLTAAPVFYKKARMILFKESPLFTKLVRNYLNDDEYAALQWALASHPEAGDIIQGSGGLRKLRWNAQGRGKRGGLRVIYYWRSTRGDIWLLTIYAKNEAENIPAHILRRIKEEVDDEKT